SCRRLTGRDVGLMSMSPLSLARRFSITAGGYSRRRSESMTRRAGRAGVVLGLVAVAPFARLPRARFPRVRRMTGHAFGMAGTRVQPLLFHPMTAAAVRAPRSSLPVRLVALVARKAHRCALRK